MKLKTKPASHKSENTFRYLTFSERLANVNIDVIHRIDRTGSYAEEVETYFFESLMKWKDLNLTEHFTSFLREVSSKSQSFNMLVFHQDAIVESLKTHLSVKNSMAYQPLLDLVVQLARDLQMDFYPHFCDFFIIITSLLDKQDTEVLEGAFTSLSYLYKYLWRMMVKDMDKIYSLYSKLLAHKKDHIRNFAAESFSFLMRKVADYDALFTLMFSNLSEHPQKAKGVGQLIFEMCRGVRNMFHSCAATALPVVLKKLGAADTQDVDLSVDSVKEALDQMVESSANYVDREHLLPLWDSLQGSLKEVLGKLEVSNANQANEHLEGLLYIYHTLVEHRNGVKITNPQSVCETLLHLVQASGLSYSCCRLLLQVVTSFLMGENLSLPTNSIQELVKTVFNSGMDRDLILSFSKEMFDMKQFEQLFLPSLLVYLERIFCTEDTVNKQLVLELLVRLILSKAPPPTDGSMAFEKYPLVFTGQHIRSTGPERDQHVSVPQQVASFIDVPVDQPLCDLSLSWAALVLLPHIRPLEAASVIAAVTTLLNRLLDEVCSETLGRGGLFVARQALSTLLSFKETAAVLSLLPVELVRGIIEKFPTDISALLLGDLYYTRLSLSGCSSQLSHDSLLDLYHVLHSNFSSNISKIRLLTSRILSNFEADLLAQREDSSTVQTVFSICLQSELVPATVQDYREKLLHLRKLRHDLVQSCLPRGPFHEAPLRYLIAMLFVNFQPLWDPVIELLVSHAKEMDNRSFWKVYYEHLQMVAGLAEEELQMDEEDDEDDGTNQAAVQIRGPGTDVIDSGDVGVLFLDQLDQTSDPSERTDFTNFRSLLWRTMAQFPDRVEPRSRELSPLLLRFTSNEFYLADLLVAPTQNFLKKSSSSSEQEMAEDDDVDMEDEENEDDFKHSKRKLPRRAATKQLIAHLRVFSKFTNPRSLYLEPSLYKLYTELLCHKDQQLQKIALDCLMTYKDPNIIPYKENLERLLDDKYFKDEIVHFNIEDEGTVVQTSHRPQLIPMLMRILYGRMRTKMGNKFQGKSSATSRSSIVLRFLAGCQPEEMGMFIDLLLEPVHHHGEDPCLVAVERAVAETDPSAALPVGRLHSLLNIIDIIIHKLGHLIHIHLHKVLQILLCITASVSFLLDHREQLKAGCISPLKNLRRLGILHIQDFFDGFVSYSFTADELDAVFEAVVWPQVCRLPTESPYAPTPLLKLIYVWSQNARFFPLLAKQRPDHPECDVLGNVFTLLSVKNLSPNTVTTVINMAESLLITPDFEPTENESELIVNNCVIPEAEQSSDSTDSLTVGCRLLIPHVSAVLQYLSGVVRNSERLKKKKFRSQVSKELNVLSKISRFVTDKQQSSTLISLLLPYLHKPNTAQETELDILGTVQNLLRQCSDPGLFLKPFCKLCSVMHNKLPRQALCEVFKTLSDLNSDFTYIKDVVIELNAFDSRHLDEIYFDVRLTAFQKANKYIKEMNMLDLNYLSAVMHNCFHSIEIGDMSLADCATMCLSVIMTQLASVGCPKAEYREIVQCTILDAVRKGLKSKTENVRNDYTTVLASLIKTLPDRSEFRDLVQLTDHNDAESDFFEHMKHIQMHRRGRALRKFAKQLTEGTVVMSSRAMQNYIMPYAMIALFDEKLLKYEPMTTAAVELIGAICKRLSWSQYLYYLKQFVHILQTGLTEQKLAVSLLVTVLDAFHFDHQTLSREIEAAKNRTTEPVVVEEELAKDEEAETIEMDECDDEDAMETDNAEAAASTVMEAVDTDTQASVKAKEGKESQEKKAPPVVSSGLPQSPQDLEALISSIHQTVTRSILPKLHKCLIAKVKRDDEHKTVKSKEVMDEEVVRVPIAFAMIQLMKTLPQDVMEVNLPGVLLKVCVHLKSRFQEIRDVARNTLVKIIESLGHQYLHYLLKEMKGVLVKGYQVHVLTFTVYHLLSILSPSLTGGDLDPCMDMLIKIFNNELFGDVAQEKDIKGIVSKVMEARHNKSFDSYELMARFCSQERIVHLIIPLKEILENTVSLKVSKRVHAVFRRIVAGLLLNRSMSPQAILLLCHGLVSQSLPLITGKNKEKILPAPDPRLPPLSCLLLPPTPKRGGVRAAINSKTNTHILVETGLSLLHCSLKTSKVNSSVASVKEMLDPFVSLLLDCLSSMHVKVITEALQAFIWILKFPLPAVEQNFDQLTKQLFILLKDYAKAGAARGENFPLVQNCFKAITVLVKSVKQRISETQLQVLLGYAEEDIYDNSRQATAFGLLRAILSRKLVVPEMEDVMKKVAKLSINGAHEQVRVRCRQIYLRYLMDYPLGKKLKNHFDFIVAQLSYEYDTGRQSALEMLAFIFQMFPQKLLLEHCGLFFVPLSLVMLNDDSGSCKKMAALAIKSLLRKLDLQHQNSMFTLVNNWLTGEKMALRRLGTQMCGMFAEVEEEKFNRRLEALIPLIEREIHISNFADIEEEEDEKAADRLLFCYLTLIVKLIKDCGFLELSKPADLLYNVWGHIDSHLRYPHSWVWLTASQIFGLLFAAHKPEDLVTLWSSQETTQKHTQPVASIFLFNNLDKKMRELTLSFCYQLQSKFLDIASGEQVVKNLLYVAKVIYLISPDSDTAIQTEQQEEVGGIKQDQEQENVEEETTDNAEENKDDDEMDKEHQEVQELEEQHNENRRPTLLWVMKKLALLAKREAANTPKVPLKRTCVFKFLGAIAVDLGKDQLGPYLTTIISPLYRELDSTYADQDPTLKNLAQELIELLKKLVGLERFSLAFAAVQKEATQRRASRKKQKAMQAVVKPDVAAKKKIKKQLKKTEAKKRTIQAVRSGHKAKRAKRSSLRDLAIMK